MNPFKGQHFQRDIILGFYAGTPDFSGNRNYAMLFSDEKPVTGIKKIEKIVSIL